MSKTKKSTRTLAILLCVAMTLSLSPMSAFAVDTVDETTDVTNETLSTPPKTLTKETPANVPAGRDSGITPMENGVSLSLSLSNTNAVFKQPEYFDIAKYGTTSFQIQIDMEVSSTYNSRSIMTTIPKGFELASVPKSSDISGASSVSVDTDEDDNTVVTVNFVDTGGPLITRIGLNIKQDLITLTSELTNDTTYPFIVKAMGNGALLDTDTMTLEPTTTAPQFTIGAPENAYRGATTSEEADAGNGLTIEKTEGQISAYMLTRIPYMAGNTSEWNNYYYYMRQRMVFSAEKEASTVIGSDLTFVLPLPNDFWDDLTDYIRTSANSSSYAKGTAYFICEDGTVIPITTEFCEKDAENQTATYTISQADILNVEDTVEVNGVTKTVAEALAGKGRFEFPFNLQLSYRNYVPDDAKKVYDPILTTYDQMRAVKPADLYQTFSNAITEKPAVTYTVLGENREDKATVELRLKLTNSESYLTHPTPADTPKLKMESNDLTQGTTSRGYSNWNNREISLQSLTSLYTLNPGKYPAIYSNLRTEVEYQYAYCPITLFRFAAIASYKVEYGKRTDVSVPDKPSVEYPIDPTADTSISGTRQVQTEILTEEDQAKGYYVKKITVTFPTVWKLPTARTNGYIALVSAYYRAAEVDIDNIPLPVVSPQTVKVTTTADQFEEKSSEFETNVVKLQDTAKLQFVNPYTSYGQYINDLSTDLGRSRSILLRRAANTMDYTHPYLALSGRAISFCSSVTFGAKGLRTADPIYWKDQDGIWHSIAPADFKAENGVYGAAVKPMVIAQNSGCDYVTELRLPLDINAVQVDYYMELRTIISTLSPSLAAYQDLLSNDEKKLLEQPGKYVNLSTTAEFFSYSEMDEAFTLNSTELPDWTTEMTRRDATDPHPDVEKYPYILTLSNSMTLWAGDWNILKNTLFLRDMDFELEKKTTTDRLEYTELLQVSHPQTNSTQGHLKDIVFDFAEANPDTLALTQTVTLEHPSDTVILHKNAYFSTKVFYRTNNSGTNEWNVLYGTGSSNATVTGKTITASTTQDLLANTDPFYVARANETDQRVQIELPLPDGEYVTDLKVQVEEMIFRGEGETYARVMPNVGLSRIDQVPKHSPIDNEPYQNMMPLKDNKITVSYKDPFYNIENDIGGTYDYNCLLPEPTETDHLYIWTATGDTSRLLLYPNMEVDSVGGTIRYGEAPYQGGLQNVTDTWNYTFDSSLNLTAGLHPTLYYKVHPSYVYEPGSFKLDGVSMPSGVKVSFAKAKTDDGYGVLKVEFTDDIDYLKRVKDYSIDFTLRVNQNANASNSILPVLERWTDCTADCQADPAIQDCTISVAENLLKDDTQKVNGDGTTQMILTPYTTTSQIVLASTIGISGLGTTPSATSVTVYNKDHADGIFAYGLDGMITANPSANTSNWIIYIPIPKKGNTVAYTQSVNNVPTNMESAASQFSVDMLGGLSLDYFDANNIDYTVAYSKDAEPEMNRLPDSSGTQSEDSGYETSVASWTADDWADVTMVRIEVEEIPANIKATFELEYALSEKKSKLGVEDAFSNVYYNYQMTANSTKYWAFEKENEFTDRAMGTLQLITYRLEDIPITGQIWKDTNYNSLLDSAEKNSGMVGVSVSVKEGSQLWGTTYQTAGVGKYALTVPSYGTYTVSTQTPDNYVMVLPQKTGGNANNWSWFARDTQTYTLTLDDDVSNLNGGMAEAPTLQIPDEITVVQGKTAVITGTVGPSYYDPGVDYISTNPTIASVVKASDNNNKAVVTGKNAGATVVTSSIPDGFGGTVEKTTIVRVTKNIETVTNIADKHVYVSNDFVTADLFDAADFSIIANTIITPDKLTITSAKRVTDNADFAYDTPHDLKDAEIGKYTVTYHYEGDDRTDAFDATRNLYVHGQPYLDTDPEDQENVASGHSRAGHAFDAFTTVDGESIFGWYNEVQENGTVVLKKIEQNCISVITYTDMDTPGAQPSVTEPVIYGRYNMTYHFLMPNGGTCTNIRTLYEHGNPYMTVKSGTLWPKRAASDDVLTGEALADSQTWLSGQYGEIILLSSNAPFYSISHVQTNGTKLSMGSDDLQTLIDLNDITFDSTAVKWNIPGVYPVTVTFNDDKKLTDNDEVNPDELGLFDDSIGLGTHSITVYVQITDGESPSLYAGNPLSKFTDDNDKIINATELMADVNGASASGENKTDDVIITSIVQKSENPTGSDTLKYTNTDGLLSDNKVKDIFAERGHYQVTYSLTVGSGESAKTVTAVRDVYVNGTPNFYDPGTTQAAHKYEVVLEDAAPYVSETPDASFINANGVTVDLTAISDAASGIDISDIDNGIKQVTYTVNLFAATGINKSYTFTRYIYINTPVLFSGIEQNTIHAINTDVNVFQDTDTNGLDYDITASFRKTVIDKLHLGTFIRIDTVDVTPKTTAPVAGEEILNESTPSVVTVTMKALQENIPADEQYRNTAENSAKEDVSYQFIKVPDIVVENTVKDDQDRDVVTVPANAVKNDIIDKINPSASTIYPDGGGSIEPVDDVQTSGPFLNESNEWYMRIVATDKNGISSTKDVMVNFQPVPIVSPGTEITIDKTDTLPTDAVMLDGVTYQQFGDPEKGNGPTWKVTDASDTDMTDNFYQTPGTYTAVYTYTDDLGQVGTSYKIIRVNDALEWNLPDVSYIIGQQPNNFVTKDVTLKQQQAGTAVGSPTTSVDLTDQIKVAKITKYNEDQDTHTLLITEVSEIYMNVTPGEYTITYEYLKDGVSTTESRRICMNGAPEIYAGNLSIRTGTTLSADTLLTTLQASANAQHVEKSSSGNPTVTEVNLTNDITVTKVDGNTVNENLQTLLNTMTATAGVYSVVLTVNDNYTDFLDHSLRGTATKTVTITVANDATGIAVIGRSWHVVAGDTIPDMWLGGAVTCSLEGYTTEQSSVEAFSDAARIQSVNMAYALKTPGIYYLVYTGKAAKGGAVGLTDTDKTQTLTVDAPVTISNAGNLRLLESTTPFYLSDSGVSAGYVDAKGNKHTAGLWSSISYYPLQAGGQDVKFRAEHPLEVQYGVKAGDGRTAEATQQVLVDGKLSVENAANHDGCALNTTIGTLKPDNITATYLKAERNTNGIYSLTPTTLPYTAFTVTTDKATSGITDNPATQEKDLTSTAYGDVKVTLAAKSDVVYANNLTNEASAQAIYHFPAHVQVVWQSANTAMGKVSGGSSTAVGGETVAQVATVTPADGSYEFTKWTVSASGASLYGATEGISETWPGSVIMPDVSGTNVVTVTFTAQFQRKAGNTISFEYLDGGSQAATDNTALSQYILSGKKAAVPTAVPDEDYLFAGWREKDVSDSPVYSSSYLEKKTFSQDMTYEAVFVNKPVVTVTFALNGGTWTAAGMDAFPGGTKTGIPGTTLSAPTAADITKTGHTLTGWTPAVPNTLPNTVATYTAQWTPVQYTLTFDVNTANGGSGTAPTSVTQNYNTSYVLTETAAPAASTYAFDGWYTAATGGTKVTSYTFINDATVYAHYKARQYYDVTFDQGTNGHFTNATDPMISQTGILSGTKVTGVPGITASNNYTFLGWTLPGDTTKYSDAAIAAMPITSTVTFTAAYQKTTTSGSGGGESTTYSVTLTKVDADDVTTKLGGTGFALYKSDGKLVANDSTGINGTLTVTGLENGTYYFVETSAPAGYKLNSDKHTFTINNSDASITVMNTKNGGTTPGGDVPDDLNSTDHIKYVVGYTDGTVRPNSNITRAEVTTMFYRLLTAARRDSIFTVDNSFPDVTEDIWFNKAVSSMAAGDYVQGYPDGLFGGNRNITRAEFVAIATRFMDAQSGVVNFTDVPTNFWAYSNIATAIHYGWINGYTDGSFRPDQPITRAEAMTIINRMLNRGVDSESKLLNFNNCPDNNSAEWYYYDVIEATNDHEYEGSRPSENWTSLTTDYKYDIAKYEQP